MIIPPYRIADSAIPHAGRGVLLCAPVQRGSVLVVPTEVRDSQLVTRIDLARLPAESAAARSALRWFEDRYTIDPEWSDECYLNHAFEPSGLWHLGFVFATRDLAVDDELTIDYSMLLDAHEELPFLDAVTGRPIRGLNWQECLRRGAHGVLALTT